ncbi:Protein cwh43 [Malassezia sp. CBS 17886]|nr:Protein cwh43 [Malassezia sp. CBS 17886]
MRGPSEPGAPILSLNGSAVALAHAVLGGLSFVTALVVCLQLHYYRVVKNGVAGYPDEWWPSVSAAIGDWFPERNLFQVLVAISSGPRFLLIALCALVPALQEQWAAAATLLVGGGIRTLSCGVWVYVTSTDHSMMHDVAMGLYLAFTPVWTAVCMAALAPAPQWNADAAHRRAQRLRTFAATCFYGCTPFMVRWYLQHKRDRIPGAYTRYSILEWALVAFDLLFDAASIWDLRVFDVHVVCRGGAAHSLRAAGSSAPVQDAAERVDAAADKPHPPPPPTPARVVVWVVSRAYLAFGAWSALTSLVPTIFYFSVSNMGVEGHELLLPAPVVSMLLVAYTPLRCVFAAGKLAVGRVAGWKRAVLWALTFLGTASFGVRAALPRLLAAAVSVGAMALATGLEWAHAWESGLLAEGVALWLVGLLGMLLAKYGNHANNPLWPFLDGTNGGAHVPALVLGAASCLPLLVPGWDLVPPVRRARAPHAILRSARRFAVASAAVGAWMCAAQTLLGDAGTVVAFGWSGFPVSGVFVIAAVALGTLLGMEHPRAATSTWFMLLSALGTTALVVCDNWRSFAGGLVVAAALPMMAIPLWQAALAHDPLRALCVSWATATVLLFLGVLTVAYAFLPGAHVMREHTLSLLLAQHALMCAGLWNARAGHVADALRALEPASRHRGVARDTVYALLALLVLAACVVPYARHPPRGGTITPYHSADRVLTAGVWTVHFGFDQGMQDSTRRISSIVRTLELDILGLLETDLQRPAFGNRDLTQWLAEDLGMYADMGPSPKKHTWGAALLSKFPIINSTHHLLPSPRGELAPALHAVLDIFGVPTHVVVSHNGQEEDPYDRELQTAETARILREAYPHPAIFLGYVVTEPHAKRPNPYEILFHDGRICDVDPADLDRWCQYLGFRGLHRVGYARVSRYNVTDTELQTFKLRVPEDRAAMDPDRDMLPRRLWYNRPPAAPWVYPTSLIGLNGSIENQRHMYAPLLYPQYFAEAEHVRDG